MSDLWKHSVSTQVPAVNGTLGETGGKRHGKRLRRDVRETRIEAIPVKRLAELVETFGSIEATTVKRGKRQYARLVKYYDPSRVKPR